MTARKVKKQSSRYYKTNVSQILEVKKTKPTNNHTVTRKHTAAIIIILQQWSQYISKIEKIKKTLQP